VTIANPPPAPTELDEPRELGSGAEVDMRPALLRALTDLYLQRPMHTPEDERCYTELALRLVDAVDISERAALAARLARYPSAPRPVIERLARDVIEVATPILERPTCLAPSEHKALAVGHNSVIASMVPAPSPVQAPAEPSSAVRNHSASAEPCDLSELFYAAGVAERRLILMNLDYAALIPSAFPSTAARADIWRLEAAALQGDAERVMCALERMLGLSSSQARRIVNDELGEPMVVVAKAINLRVEVLQRMLTSSNPSRAQSADRRDALAALHSEISGAAARRLVAIWRSADAAGNAEVRPSDGSWRGFSRPSASL